MDILKSLASDHRELKVILKRLDMTTERGVKTREKLFVQLRNLLVSHSKSEEAVLYDRLRKIEKYKDDALEGYEEHHVASSILRELATLSKESERWGAKLSVLKEMLEHHIEEEEDELFEATRKTFELKERREMGEEFETLKNAHLSGIGLPARAAVKLARRLAG